MSAADVALPATAIRPSVPARILMLPIRAWRLLSVHLPPRCRFHPSCSQYALEALTVHGAARGSWLAVKRVGRCHPWHDGGLDPVPPAEPVPPRRLHGERTFDPARTRRCGGRRLTR